MLIKAKQFTRTLVYYWILSTILIKVRCIFDLIIMLLGNYFYFLDKARRVLLKKWLKNLKVLQVMLMLYNGHLIKILLYFILRNCDKSHMLDNCFFFFVLIYSCVYIDRCSMIFVFVLLHKLSTYIKWQISFQIG